MTNVVQEKIVGTEVSPELRNGLAAWRNSPEMVAEIQEVIGEELPVPERLQGQFNSIRNATYLYYADRLGLNISDRLPELSNLHYLSEDNFLALRQRLGKVDDELKILGFPLGERELVVREFEEPDMIPYVIQHEIIHIIAAQITRLVKEENGLRVVPHIRTGFHGKAAEGNHAALEEYVTEKTTRDIIARYWSEFEELENIHPTTIGHEDVIKLGDSVLSSLNGDQDAILLALQKAHMSGDMSGPKGIYADIKKRWGEEKAREIMKARVGSGAAQAAMKLTDQPR